MVRRDTASVKSRAIIAGMNPTVILAVLALALAPSPGNPATSNGKIDPDVRIAAGQTPADVHTINGNVRLDAKAAAKDITTVNGNIVLDPGAQTGKLATVNGSVTLGAGAALSGGITTVTGAVRLADGAEVGGGIQTASGTIALGAAHVAKGLTTTAGDIRIGADAKVDGGITVDAPAGAVPAETLHQPTITIGPRAQVPGTLAFHQPVRLLVSASAQIGKVEGATATPVPDGAP